MPLKRYRSPVADSQRWDDFVARPGDIVVTTPPKCGTTWTQMICALLVFQTPASRTTVPSLAVDRHDHPIASDLFTDLAAQGHRRFVKTHTPLDGLPTDPSVTYVCVGRDPRDAAISMHHHRDNLDLDQVLQARARAAAEDGIELDPTTPAPPAPRRPCRAASGCGSTMTPILRRRCRASAARCTTSRRTAPRHRTSTSCSCTTAICSATSRARCDASPTGSTSTSPRRVADAGGGARCRRCVGGRR